ncbi:MAG: GNAT family N-acetyltransferase [Ktedonobacterales bacterium]
MTFEIRSITPEEYRSFWYAIHVPFGERPTERSIEAWRTTLEFDRTLAVLDSNAGNRIVATTGAYSLELTLPGGTMLPAAGVTWVGVLPTHRRQGLLTSLMRRQLDDTQARGEALAILTASESSIYSRFGYGEASDAAYFEIDRRHVVFAQRARSIGTAGRISLIEHEEALDILPTVYDRVRAQQAGAVSRSPEYWSVTLHNPYEPADGFGPRFYVTYTSAAGTIDGAAHYRVKPNWEQGSPAHTLWVAELLAATPVAYAGLWRYLLSIDLVATIRATRRRVDEPLRWLLDDPRRLRYTAVADDLWLRLLDIPVALGARSYRTRDRIVFEVADAFRPQVAGRYLLEARPDGASCRAYTAAEADLVLDVSDLGAVYLGGVNFSTLARAGRVEERTPGTLARADLLFSTDQAPYCGTPF